MTDLVTEGEATAAAHVVLAHGAGAPLDSPFMRQMAALLVARGLRVSRFNFAYMAVRQATSKRRPPPRADLLNEEYLRLVDRLGGARRPNQRFLIGGKSMGGRVASMVADRLHAAGRIDGLVCLGYPFHPVDDPAQLRTAHLETLATPALIVQGERDPFGSRAEVEGYKLAASIDLVWLPDGDHDFGPRGGSGFTRKGNLATAADAVAAFAARL